MLEEIEEQIKMGEQDKSADKQVSVWSLLFADDNKAGGSNHTVEDTALLQKVLNLIYQWSQDNSMRINAIKTYGL